MATDEPKRRLMSRLAWFVGLYVTSLIGFAVLVYGLRALGRQ